MRREVFGKVLKIYRINPFFRFLARLIFVITVSFGSVYPSFAQSNASVEPEDGFFTVTLDKIKGTIENGFKIVLSTQTSFSAEENASHPTLQNLSEPIVPFLLAPTYALVGTEKGGMAAVLDGVANFFTNLFSGSERKVVPNTTTDMLQEIEPPVEIPSAAPEVPQEKIIEKIVRPSQQARVNFVSENPIPAPVIERVIERTIEVPARLSGVSEGTLNERLNQLENALKGEIYRVASNAATRSNDNFAAIALTNRINNLANVTISGATITSSTFDGSLTGSNGSFTGAISGATASFTGASNFGSTLYVDSVNSRVGVGTSSPSDTLSLNGPLYFSQVSAPSVTTNRLYNSGGALYFNGSVLGGASGLTSLNGLTGGTQTFATTSANGGFGFSSSGTTHTFNIPTASASNALGLLSGTDWTTFNSKGAGTVTSVAATVPSIFSISGSPITTSGTLAMTYSGTALPVVNGGTGLTSTPTYGQLLVGSGSGYTLSATSTLGVALSDTVGTLAVSRGGTGLASYTLGDLVYASGTGTLAGTSTANLKNSLALNNVENTALSTWAGSTNLTTLGTITSGTWNGGTISIARGGTGQTSFGQGWIHSDGSTLTASTSPTVNYLTATSTTATSTFAGGIQVGSLNVTSTTASSTFSNGVSLSAGCFAVGSTCIGGGASTYLALTDTPSSFTAKAIPYTNTGATALLHSASFVFDGTNFGVGTTTPAYKLSIEGSSTLGNEAIAGYFTGTSTTATSTYMGSLFVGTTTPAGNRFAIQAKTGQNEPFAVYNSSGNTAAPLIYTGLNTSSLPGVGINTNSMGYATLAVVDANTTYQAPNAPAVLLVQSQAGGESTRINVRNNSGGVEVEIGAYAGGWGFIGSSLAQDFGINTSNIDRLRVTAGGNIGISTTTPYSKLSVWGSGTGTGQVFEITNNASTTIARFNDNGTGYFLGNIGVGTTTPWRKFSVTGTVAFNGLTTSATGNAVCITTGKDITDAGGGTCTPSSQRFKENIFTLTPGEALSTLGKLRVVSFDYKSDYTSPEESPASLGLIAEEVERVDPRLVDYGYDGLPLTLHFERITGLTVGAVQELDLNLETIAGNTASSTPESRSFASSFFSNLFTQIVEKFASVANGIGDFFAQRIHTKTLCVGDSISGETCVTKTELDKLLAGVASGQSSGSTLPTPSPIAIASTTPATVEIVISGNNPQIIEKGTSWGDLGAVASSTDQTLVNFGVRTFQNDIEIATPSIDTKKTGMHEIVYKVLNGEGVAMAQAVRTVKVVDSTVPVVSIATTTSLVIASSTPIFDDVATSTLLQ